MTPRTLATVAALALAVTIAPACGSDSDSDAATDATTTTAATSAPTITGAWARTSPSDSANGAMYFTVKGGSSDDRITGVSVPSSVAMSVDLHETVMASDTMETMPAGDSMSSTTLAPAMEMQPVDAIEVGAGKTVELKPGGYHVMLMDLAKPLAAGDTFQATVTFETAGDVKVDVTVKDAP